MMGPGIGAVAPGAPVNSVAPAATGTATVGSTLTCSTGAWTNSPTGYTYQWQRNGANISGATASTYLLVAADGGTSVRCNVTATNASGSASAASNSVSVATTAPVNSVAPVASGTATVGSVLSCTTGTWTNSPTSYAYQWQRNGVNISGATSSSYTTVTADGGTSVSCNVTATNASGSATQASNALAIAAAWTPASLPNLVAWYDGQNAASITLNGSTVAQWNDQSPNAYNAVQGTAAKQPTYNATGLNGKPALVFDGSTSLLSATVPSGAFSSEITFYWISTNTNAGAAGAGGLLSRLNTIAGDADPLGFNAGLAYVGNGTSTSDRTFPSGCGSFTVPTLYGADAQSTTPPTFTDWVNGTQANSGTVTGSVYGDTFNVLSLGSASVPNWGPASGTLGEAVVCAGIVTANRQKLEGYMAWRWGIQANLPAGHPYKGAPP